MMSSLCSPIQWIISSDVWHLIWNMPCSHVSLQHRVTVVWHCKAIEGIVQTEAGDLVLPSIHTSICTSIPINAPTLYLFPFNVWPQNLQRLFICLQGLLGVIFQDDPNSKNAARWPFATWCEIWFTHNISISIWLFDSKYSGIIHL